MRAPRTVALFLAIGLAPAAAHSADLIPSRLANNPAQPIAFWLSAEAAVKPNGTMRWNAFVSSAARQMADAKRAEFAARRAKSGGEFFGPLAPEDCRGFLGSSAERNPGTFAEMQKHARGSFVGVVEASGVGFFNGLPSTLLRVRPDRWLRGDPALRAMPAFSVPYPVAHFHLGDNVFCGGAPDETAPLVGARVVLFVSPDSPAELLPFVSPGMGEFFAEGPEGELLVQPPRSGPQPCGTESFADFLYAVE